MMRALAAAAAAMMTTGANAALLTYEVDAKFYNGASINGLVTLNNATALFTAAGLVSTNIPTLPDNNYTYIRLNNPSYLEVTHDSVSDTGPEFGFSPAITAGYNATSLPISSVVYYYQGVLAFGYASTYSSRLLTTSDVPEPAAWAMMVAGFGMAGAALRRRRVSSVVIFV